MNSYQLISKLKKIRDDTFLTATDQALYHELISMCNDKSWKEVFDVRSNVLCSSLNIWDKTLRKSRKVLADAGLISFESCKDKRIGCYYSFTQKLSNDMKTSVISSVPITDENTGEIADDAAEVTQVSSVLSTEEITVPITDEEKTTSVISSVPITDDSQFPPYKRIETINREESLVPTHEDPPPEKPKKAKKSKKEEGDNTPLVYPFSSIGFMSAWEVLRQTPKWKKKLNLALQLSLNKLGQFEEEFAIRQIERAIESDWTGVVFTGTERDYQEWLNLKNGKSINEVSKQGTYSNGKSSQDKASSRQSLEDLADAILGQLASEDCP